MSNLEFTQHFNQFRALLYSFAYRLTQNEEEARDLVQETAFKAFKYREMYKPQTNLRAWLMTIMRNTFINSYRQQKRRQVINDKTDNNYYINSGKHSVRNQGESMITVDEIQDAITNLEDWIRTPFLLHYQGYKYEEIAEQLDIPLGTVKSRIFFARKRLKKAIKHLYQTDSVEELLD